MPSKSPTALNGWLVGWGKDISNQSCKFCHLIWLGDNTNQLNISTHLAQSLGPI